MDTLAKLSVPIVAARITSARPLTHTISNSILVTDLRKYLLQLQPNKTKVLLFLLSNSVVQLIFDVIVKLTNFKELTLADKLPVIYCCAVVYWDNILFMSLKNQSCII